MNLIQMSAKPPTPNPHGLKTEQILGLMIAQSLWFGLYPGKVMNINSIDTGGGWFEFGIHDLDSETRVNLWNALKGALGSHYDVVVHGQASGYNMYIGFNYQDGSGKYQESRMIEE